MKSSMLRLAFLSATLVFSAYAEPSRFSSRVVNGVDAAPDAYPWTVALVSSSQPDTTLAHFCGGSLIDKEYVLTAAHCVDGASPLAIQVAYGASILPYGPGQRVDVRGIKIFPGWNSSNLDGDVALLKLEHPINLPTVSPIGQSEAALGKPGTLAHILGWGKTDPSYSVLPIKLQDGTVPIFSDGECLDTIGRYFRSDTMMCAGVPETIPGSNNGVDACYGDSGGPLVVSDQQGGYKQVGVVSWGFGCATKYPGVYAEVAQFRDFITSKPSVAPYILSYPSIDGTPEVGQPLTCSGATFGGDPAEKVDYVWLRDGQVINGAGSASYTLTQDDTNAYVNCIVTASNAAGSDSGMSDSFGPIASIVTPTPLPQATVATTDTTAPVTTRLAFDCETNKRHCLFVAQISDNQTVASVSGTVSILVDSKCKSKRSGNRLVSCTKTQVSKVSGSQLTVDTWGIPVPRQRKNVKAKLVINASDTAGNVESPGLNVTLQIPRRK